MCTLPKFWYRVVATLPLFWGSLPKFWYRLKLLSLKKTHLKIQEWIFFFTSKLGGLSLNFEDIKIFEKLNFWCKIVAQPTPFLGQIEPKYVQVGPILVQFGHVLNLHLLSRSKPSHPCWIHLLHLSRNLKQSLWNCSYFFKALCSCESFPRTCSCWGSH